MSATPSRTDHRAIVRVASGNLLEMYDFIVYGYYASYIARAFFPASSDFASLMYSLVTFGAGYLMRPVGAIVLGAYIDRHGRRRGLIVTLSLMAIGTASIGLTPAFKTIGILAPVIVVAGRLLQGFSAGVELGGVSVYLSEIAPPGRRGFYCAWQSASQQVGVVFTAVLGLLLTVALSSTQMAAWGWRVPLIIGCLIIPIVLWLRRSLEETQVFRQMTQRPRRAAEAFAAVAQSWRVVTIGMMLSVLTTTTFYLITVYTPTFGRQALHLDARSTFIVTLAVGVSSFICLPLAGAISDRIGRFPILITIPFLALGTAYPAMIWLVGAPSMPKLLAVELWFSFLFGFYNGAMIPLLVELMPPSVRTTAFALAYSLATAVFGGFTPAVCTYLIRRTGNTAAPAWWLMLAAAVSLAAVATAARASNDRTR